jgi:hypothetical protein
MGMNKGTELAAKEQTMQTVTRLIEAARGDTLFRDHYLQKSRLLFASILSQDEFLRHKREKTEIETLLPQSRAAVEQNDWQSARELATRIGVLREKVAEDETVMKLAADVFDAAVIALDPFSPGLHGFADSSSRNISEVRERLIGNLTLLAHEDPSVRNFYADRRNAFQSLHPAPEEPVDEPAAVDAGQLQREALKAVESGDVARFDRLMRLIPEAGLALPTKTTTLLQTSSAPCDLSERFPSASVELAAALGLAEVFLPPAPEASAYLNRYAWQPKSASPQFTPDGGQQFQNLPDLASYPPDVSAMIKETVGLFALHPFINSGGVRYLPRCLGEQLLVEDFPDAEQGGGTGGLPALLGLGRRWGLSRARVEQALFDRGNAILEKELKLDPYRFRIVCIPADVYCRTGREHHWGEHPFWTHFDGYQLLQNGGMRALVGGDVRYGGIFDLCSISRTDEREGVVVRFAVVRRERMACG